MNSATRSRRGRRLAATALSLSVVAFGLTVLSGQPALAGTASTGLQPVAQEGDGGRMVLILDSSGSMKERSSGGETKIGAAKKALDQVIGSLPPDQSVGLRVYGAKVFNRSDPGACTDSQLVVPVGTDNRSDLRSAVAKYRPYGETPIGYALQQAGKDLGSEGHRTIVLVSDGEPTCAPDPCKVARDLSHQGVDLKINVVGLDVDGAARQKLQCIAGAGGGTYYDVDSSEEFAASLEKLATRAQRPFAAIGQPVTGTPTATGAPTIAAGDWQDVVGTSESELTKNYLVQRKIPGSSIHVSGALRTASGSGESVEVRLSTPDGQQCDLDTGFGQLGNGQLIAAGALGDGYDSFGEKDPKDPCGSADQLVATVEDKVTDVTGPRALELRVIEEPPVGSTSGLPKPAENVSWKAPASGPGSPVTGGASFADAPLLQPGSYKDSIVPGEVLTYQVDVGWGQQLSAQVNFPQPSSKLGAAIGNGDVFTRMDVFGPDRRPATASGIVGQPSSQSFLPPAKHEAAVATAPVAYLNRTTSAGGADMAGHYTVTLFLEDDPDKESYLVPFTLDLAVTGAVKGAPSYTRTPAPVDSPSAAASPGAGSSADTSAASSSTDGGGPGAGLLLGGLGVLALVAAGGLVIRSRSGGAG